MTAPGQERIGSVMADLTDAELVACLGAGDARPLEEVYRRHGSQVIAVANAVLGDRESAEEVCCDVFVRLFRQPQTFDSGRGSLRTYLVVIAHGRAVDRLRADAAQEHEGDRPRSLSCATEDVAAKLWAAMSTLPPDEAEALRLACYGGATYREVAHALEVAEEIIKRRIRSGLCRLRSACVEQRILSAT